MKPKEIYKVVFSGLYATATLKAELEPRPYLVNLNQVEIAISKFNGLWCFHVWVEAKSKKAAIRKGAVQIMEWFKTKEEQDMVPITLGTMETLLEQKAAWEVLKAEEEAKGDTAPEEEVSSDEVSGKNEEPALQETEVSTDEEEEKDEEKDEEVCSAKEKYTEGYVIALSTDGCMNFNPDKKLDYAFPLKVSKIRRCEKMPTLSNDQIEIDKEGLSDFSLYIYVTRSELGMTAGTEKDLEERAVRVAFTKLKWKLKDLSREMGNSIAEEGGWSTYKFKVGDTVYLAHSGQQYTTYFSLFGDMVSQTYFKTRWSPDNEPLLSPIKQGKAFSWTLGSEPNNYAKLVVRAREEVWEPILNKFTNIYLVQLIYTSGSNEFRGDHEAGELHLIGEAGLSSEAVSIQM